MESFVLLIEFVAVIIVCGLIGVLASDLYGRFK